VEVWLANTSARPTPTTNCMQNAAATITEGKNDDFVSIEIANFWRSNYLFLTT
jgi:hypothetical protein